MEEFISQMLQYLCGAHSIGKNIQQQNLRPYPRRAVGLNSKSPSSNCHMGVDSGNPGRAVAHV
eukprot:3579108-Amphidinium_carterae.1